MRSELYLKGVLNSIQLPEPLFLVEPIIPMGGLMMLHGPKTAGKTQLAISLASAVASGTPFLGEYACRQGEVVFVETDMTRRLLQERIQKTPETTEINFLVSEPFDVVEMASRRLPDAFQNAQKLCPSLVIVDSLRKTSRQDEVDSSSPGKVYGSWQKIFPDAVIAIIHHDRKAPTAADALLRPEEAARGSGAWLDDIDTGLHLSKLRGHKHGGHVATLSFSKCRTTEEPEPMSLLMDSHSLLLRPMKVTARAAVAAFRVTHPNASTEELVEYLTTNKVCGRSRAYELAKIR